MTRIMFVCHGNICRSPMAEFIFKKLVDDMGLSSEFIIKSSATSTEEIIRGVGNPIYPPAARELQRRSIPYTDRRATQLSIDDLEKYDLFIGMDSANIRNMNRILGEGAGDKIFIMLICFVFAFALNDFAEATIVVFFLLMVTLLTVNADAAYFSSPLNEIAQEYSLAFDRLACSFPIPLSLVIAL